MSENEIKLNTVPITIENEMKSAYLDYAMSVIVGRALPDVRDGLKSVHRRVLFAMYDLGNTYNKQYKKSARVVGDVIGKYHPHGDIAVYDSLVRMAQPFSLRYPLIDGQGNFGSIDGDAPAAMRYTEVRMEKITNELLADLEKECVDFVPNYDDSIKEPSVLPCKIPNLLINGSSGIAVGMATNIPPHNLSEVVDALLALIQDPEISLEGLLKHIKGPDFPTGAFILGGENLKQAYSTGRGTVILRGKTNIESWKNDREKIIITELPYQVNKARLIERIADLVRDKKIEGISDLRDESDRKGMRVVIEVKKGENAQVILNKLYKLTQLQESYGINLLAIDRKKPKSFSLKELLVAFLEHRKEIVYRCTFFDYNKAKDRAHLLEGLTKAINHLDKIIGLIRTSENPVIAKQSLIEVYQLTEIQAQAILEMRLQRLTSLERDKIQKDYQETLKLIENLKNILGQESLIYNIIREELNNIKTNYGDLRRTQIVNGVVKDFEVEDLISDEETLVSITHAGYIKRSDLSQFKLQHRGGRGIKGLTTTEEDFAKAIYHCNTLSNLLCFTNHGRVYLLKVYQIPEVSRNAKGKAIVNLLALQENEKIKAILPVKEFTDNEFIVMVTSAGIIKKTSLSEFKSIRTSGVFAITIDEGDELVSAKLTRVKSDIFLSSKKGMSIRFSESDVRSVGRTARGVIGMDLDSNDCIVALEVFDSYIKNTENKKFEILTVTENGYGKRTPVKEYRLQSRGGVGVINMKTLEKNGHVIGSSCVLPKDDLMLITNRGQMIRIHVGEISEQGRNTQGVRLISVGPNEKVVSFESIVENELDEGYLH